MIYLYISILLCCSFPFTRWCWWWWRQQWQVLSFTGRACVCVWIYFRFSNSWWCEYFITRNNLIHCTQHVLVAARVRLQNILVYYMAKEKKKQNSSEQSQAHTRNRIKINDTMVEKSQPNVHPIKWFRRIAVVLDFI